MKRIFSLIFVFLMIFSVVSCGKKKKEEIPGYEEQVSKEITAEEGGSVKSSDESISIDIPGGALEGDTTITMTVYDAAGYAGTEGKKVVSKIVEFEPSGTIFKKPVIITMKSGEAVENKVITAAVLNGETGEWSYSETGAAVMIAGKDAAGDPIMQTAAGDPIMLNAAGDPIMMSAAGDPIMMSAAGDPIMVTAAGDPIMMAAAGDPIMMTTGHFTAYTFLAIDPKGDEPAETDDDEPVETDDDEPVETDDDEPVETDDDEPIDDGDTEPEPEPVYSKVICTGQRSCVNDSSEVVECPKEGGTLYGQDAQYISRKSCVPQSFERLAKAETDETVYQQTKDNNTGLVWLFTEESGSYGDIASLCDDLEYDGHDDWRLPSPKELLTIADHDIFNWANYAAVRSLFFPEIAGGCEGCQSLITSDANFSYNTSDGTVSFANADSYSGVMCVRGDEYGKVAAENYTTVPENGEEMIFDSGTNLFWQKTAVSGKTFAEALSYCESLEYAGHSDWRLPNKNELVSLVDYSRSNPASSFPGMPAEKFVSSTTGFGFVPASVDMKTGEIQASASGQAYSRDTISDEVFSVRCVRSDIEPYPENGIPTCGKDGYAPCKDAESGIVWSSRIWTESMDAESIPWMDLARKCREMGGKWRIPTVDEVRTLFTDDVIKTGETCGVTVDNAAYIEDCSSEAVKYSETKLMDYGIILSGTISNIEDDREGWSVWSVYMSEGTLTTTGYFFGPELVARCVQDDSIADPEEIPYTDTENGLVWSSVSGKGDWRDAVDYCGTLVEGGSDNWRVPTAEELMTLVRNCPDGECAPDLGGKYSAFSELSLLLSSTIFEDAYMTTVDFVDVWVDSNREMASSYDDLQVRCVRSVSDPLEDPSNVDEETGFPVVQDGMAWSKKSGPVGTGADAQAYCDSLNEEGYGGFDTWTLPANYIFLGALTDECETLYECTEYESLYMGDIVNCSCGYTFTTHSVFNDYGKFWGGEDESYFLFNMSTGEINGISDYYSYQGYVRCVAEPCEEGYYWNGTECDEMQ